MATALEQAPYLPWSVAYKGGPTFEVVITSKGPFSNSISSAADARLKYTARHLFHAVTPNFVSRRYDRGPFRLFCDDFRTGNILVDDSFKITGIIDWEWCYAMPFQFTYAPPRWLLLKQPAYWNFNLDKEDLLNVYSPKLELFLRISKHLLALR